MAFPGAPKRKQFLLIAGVDYVNFEIDFAALCRLRIKQLIAEHKGTAELKILVYDFAAGTITTINVPRFFTEKTKEVTEQLFKPITVKDYPGFKKANDNELKRTITGVMSVTDVYAAITAIGKTSPGELLEWSFFIQGGTFSNVNIVNSFSDGKVHGDAKAFKKLPKGSRDPDDLDPGFGFDFEPPRMSAAEFKTFKAAFDAKNGYTWFWEGELFILEPKSLEAFVAKRARAFRRSFGAIDGLTENMPGDTIVSIPMNKSVLVKEFFSIWEDSLQSLIVFAGDTILIPLFVLKYITCQAFFNFKGFARRMPVKTYGLFNMFNAEFSSNNSRLPEAPIFDARAYDNIRKILGLEYAPQGDYIEFPAGFTCVRPTARPVRPPKVDPAEPEKPVKPSPPLNLSLLQPTHPFFRLNEYARHYIFVAGVDFQNSGADFPQAARNRIDYLLRLDDNRDSALVQVLDVAAGAIRYCEISYETGTRSVAGFEVSTENRHALVRFTTDDVFGFEPVKNDSSDYETQTDAMGNAARFFSGEQQVMSMSFIYERIRAISEQAPGRLRELSFFTHGDESGPKTVNEGTSEKRRKAADFGCLDPDPYRDFPGEIDAEEFSKAFHDLGASRCWGYETDAELQKLIKATVNSKEYNAPGLTDETIITLRNPTPRLRLFVQRAAKLIRQENVPPVKIKIPFGRLLHFFADLLKSSYAFRLAVVTGKNVYAGVPGQQAMREATGDGLFAVPAAYEPYAAFFKTHFGFKTDPEKRGYLEYIPDFPWEDAGLAGVKIEQEILEEVKEFPVEEE